MGWNKAVNRAIQTRWLLRIQIFARRISVLKIGIWETRSRRKEKKNGGQHKIVDKKDEMLFFNFVEDGRSILFYRQRILLSSQNTVWTKLSILPVPESPITGRF